MTCWSAPFRGLIMGGSTGLLLTIIGLDSSDVEEDEVAIS